MIRKKKRLAFKDPALLSYFFSTKCCVTEKDQSSFDWLSVSMEFTEVWVINS